MTQKLYLGSVGWSYDDWKGTFYPPGVPKTKWLGVYAKHYNTVEINSTFHAVPPEKNATSWTSQVPDDFRFSLKVWGGITHQRQLANCEKELTTFLNFARLFGEKLGILLFQLPPIFTPEKKGDVLLRFLDALPRDEFRYVFELRKAEWYEEKWLEELRARKISLCWSDLKGMPKHTHVTGDFVYARIIGDRDLTEVYTHRVVDKSDELNWWAEQTAKVMRKKIPVYFFIDKTFTGYAPDDITDFERMLKEHLDKK